VPTYHATIHTTEPRKQYTNLFEHSYRHTDPYATTLYTTFKTFVPTPRNGQHLPAILMSIKNGKGDCLIRFTPEGLEALIAHLSSINLSPSITEAFQQASFRINTYNELERIAFAHESP